MKNINMYRYFCDTKIYRSIANKQCKYNKRATREQRNHEVKIPVVVQRSSTMHACHTHAHLHKNCPQINLILLGYRKRARRIFFPSSFHRLNPQSNLILLGQRKERARGKWHFLPHLPSTFLPSSQRLPLSAAAGHSNKVHQLLHQSATLLAFIVFK